MREITEQEKSTAATFGSLSLAIFATSLIVDERWHTIALIVGGSFFALCGLYLILPFSCKQSWFFKRVVETQTMTLLKYFGWFLVLAALGTNLVQSDIGWLKVLGILFALVAFFVLLFGLSRKGEKARTKKE